MSKIQESIDELPKLRLELVEAKVIMTEAIVQLAMLGECVPAVRDMREFIKRNE